MEEILSDLKSLLKPGIVVLIFIALLIINSWIFKRIRSVKTSIRVFKNTLTILIVLIGILILIFSLPIDNSFKGQIISFLAIIISAGIALSSTTVLGNLIAGIMNNSMNRFKNGDLINIGELQGRVTKKGIFHTEIQLEDSNFITIPNLYIATNPVKLTRKTNSVISTSISLGYDISRVKIEECLKNAAIGTGLKNPYVYITELGDFSVVYKIHGFLEDSGQYFSTSSRLNANVMDALHQNGIEIVSPSFMNQRQVDKKQFIPEKQVEKPIEKDVVSPEDLIFDKAIKSEEIEEKQEYLKEINNRIDNLKEDLKKTDDEKTKEKLQASIKRFEELYKRIKQNIEEQIELNNK